MGHGGRVACSDGEALDGDGGRDGRVTVATHPCTIEYYIICGRWDRGIILHS